ncbi:MAG: nickel-dependent lactate racemase [Euryarchaeota archaeon]|nr:nickel-dependent lactate racemase [Euryarchaeota archaeon]
MHLLLPYGKHTVPLDVPDKNLLDVILPKEIVQPERPEFLIKNALEKPLGTDRLTELAGGGDKVAIVVDDYTRPCPTQKLLSPVLEKLREAKVDVSDILIIVACGTHKPPSPDQIKEILGEKIARTYQVTSNDITNGDYVTVGTTKRGNTIEVLRDYVEADVKILLGDVEYHYFAGYGGTRKSILPGISSNNTIQRNHKLLFHEHAQTGVLKDNPIHMEMNEAMHLAGCDFAFNVVMDSAHQIVGAWAGKPEAVLDIGSKLVDTMYKREVKERADIVVVSASGYPHDIDLYQAYKGLHTALPVINKNGVVVFVAECLKGIGNGVYVDYMKNYKTSQEITTALKEKFVMGAHKAYYHLKAIEEHKVFCVSSLNTNELKTIFGLTAVANPNKGLTQAFALLGNDAKVRVIPQGTTTLLVLK